MTRATYRGRPRRVALLSALALVLAGLAVGGLAGPATAAPPTTEVIEDSFTTAEGGCGFRTTLTSSTRIVRTVRTATGQADGFPLATERITYRDRYADPVSGEPLFVVTGNFQVKQIKAKPIEGGLYQVTAKFSGVQFMVKDATGRARGHDSGTVTVTYIADQDGNGVEFLNERSPGPPRDTLCAVVGSFLGSDSASRLTAHPAGTTDSPLGYYEYLPPGYRDTGAPKPLLLFFHGYGESGDGSAEQLPILLSNAIPRYIASNNWPADRPFVVLAPQHNGQDDPNRPYDCPEPNNGTCVMQLQHDRGNPGPPGSPCTRPQEVEQFLDYAVENYNIDPNRVYLTGLSCGAYGVWEAVPNVGDRIAAAVPIAGNGSPAFDDTDCEQWSSPLWAFHGSADQVVNVSGSVEPIEGLRACSPPPTEEPRLTVYPGVDHNSWDLAYTGTGDEDIFDWMLGLTSG